jgi:hypothetical protein
MVMENYQVNHPARDSDKENGYIETINGTERVWWNGYAIKHYSPPEKDDYLEEILENLEERLLSFFRHAESGIRPPRNIDLDKYIEILREEYQDASPDQQRVHAAYLVGALFWRVADKLKEGIIESEGEKLEVNNPQYQAVGADIMEANSLLKFVRRKGIKKFTPYEVDQVLNGIWGEFIQPATLGVTQYQKHSYLRLADAMAEIDKVFGAIKEVIEANKVEFPYLMQAVPIFEELASVAKCRSEIIRSDSGDKEKGVPAFRHVHAAFDAASSNRQKFKKELKERFEDDMPRGLEQLLGLVSRAGNFMVSMAKIRAKEDGNLLKEFYQECQELIGENKDKGHRR